ncbi:hypothetical protein B296_00013766 [Ensete ventricosum]|uniref:Uncharacterized protein n=1 Tax=Ensete ventricosum TaxID=4639 RepID=A0A426XAS2_ENSVE|nr:hypothetical protein B296_00013766 [Ensete ventricosum]
MQTYLEVTTASYKCPASQSPQAARKGVASHPLHGRSATAKPPVGVADHDQGSLQRGYRLRLGNPQEQSATASPQPGHGYLATEAARKG